MIIRSHDRPATPWKNGQGRTRELATCPPGADMDSFQWRVSVAEVDSAAPFSTFPGVDRCIVLLDGAGFIMTLDDERQHALLTPFVPFAFPGEAKVSVTLAGGATRDFNLMLRRHAVRGSVEVWRDADPHVVDATVALVYCAHGTLACAEGELHAGDAWLPGDDRRMTWQQGTVVLVVRVEVVGG
ncbi:HutD family protein [Dyella sp. A6]|uniref:HutD/Ves family protein n=1 Tax=Dyella aluminiiresistens TaxID=3069105 RepID=UPI002E789EF3|nr:HutD family protein [Dyella sp. A6]